MVIYIQEFFETLIGTSLPQWFYNTIALVITMCSVRGLLNLAFPRLSKYSDTVLLVATLGYIAYEVLPVWGIAVQGVS